MKWLATLILLLLFGCNSGGKKENEVNSDHASVIDTPIHNEVDRKDTEFMDYREIKYQGILSRYFSVEDFQHVFGQIDSLLPVSADAPCDDGLFWYKHDGTHSPEELDSISQYWFKDGSKYERFADSVAIDNFKLSGGNFIVYKDVRFDASSTIEDFGKLFPTAVQAIVDIDVYQEGVLQVMQLQEEPQGISDGHLRIFFKNGLFYMIHHWFPC